MPAGSPLPPRGPGLCWRSYAQVLEFRYQVERSRDAFDGLANLPDVFFAQAIGPGSQAQITDPRGIDSHDAAASRVYRRHVRARNQDTDRLGIALDGTVAFHADNAVHDREVTGEGRMKIGDTFIDARPVQYILRPSVHASRDQAEEILHAERGAHPVMRFHFGERDQEVSPQSSVREI